MFLLLFFPSTFFCESCRNGVSLWKLSFFSNWKTNRLVFSGHSTLSVENQQLRQERDNLSEKLASTKDTLKDALEKLSRANQRKESVERAICKQLTKTHHVLKKAKGNLKQANSLPQWSKQVFYVICWRKEKMEKLFKIRICLLFAQIMEARTLCYILFYVWEILLKRICPFVCSAAIIDTDWHCYAYEILCLRNYQKLRYRPSQKLKMLKLPGTQKDREYQKCKMQKETGTQDVNGFVIYNRTIICEPSAGSLYCALSQ